MSKRKNLFKDITTDDHETICSIFNQAYKLHNFNSCPGKDHKNNEHNPWCLHGLGLENWLHDTPSMGVEEDDQDHFTIRPKYLGKYSGLRNLGATCYVNSLAQILFFNDHFRQMLYKYSPPSDEAGCVIRCLQQLLVNLEHSARGVVDTTALVSALQLPFTEQQDVVEFRELLFGMLTNSMPNIQDSYKGEGSYVMRCLTCSNITNRTSDFTDLKLQLQPKNQSLADRIKQLSAVEILDGENSYHCSHCNALRKVERCYLINKYPQTLHLQLMRFNYNASTMLRTKDTSFVKFDDELTLFNLAGNEGHTSRKYILSGIILHVGESTQSGHYIAVIRRGDKWLTFNDDVVSESSTLNLKLYDLSSTRRPGCKSNEHCSQSVYMLIYENGPTSGVVGNTCLANLIDPSSSIKRYFQVAENQSVSSQNKTTAHHSISDNNQKPFATASKVEPSSDLIAVKTDLPSGMVTSNTAPSSNLPALKTNPSSDLSAIKNEPAPGLFAVKTEPLSDLLAQAEADNHEFNELRALLQEQKWDVRSSQETKAALMRSVCCNVLPQNETDFVPVPTIMLKSWLRSGDSQILSSSGSFVPCKDRSSLLSPNSDVTCSEDNQDNISDILCIHNRLSYHKLKNIKYINKDIIFDIISCTESTPPSTTDNIADSTENLQSNDTGSSNGTLYHPMNKLALCKICIEHDLRQHLYDIHLDEDHKTIIQLQNLDADTGWWALKEDLKNFKKLVRQGGDFNKDVLCRHGQLDPQSKRRKLVSSVTQSIVQKYFKEFPAPPFSDPECEICSNESDTEQLYFSSLLLLRKDLQRLIGAAAFPFIPGLTPFIVPISFIINDLQPLYKRRLQERISLDNSILVCKHSLLASDALEHAAFIKEKEWEVLSSHFGPTTSLRCDTLDTTPPAAGVSFSPPVNYTPVICEECVMMHDAYVDQVIYLREEKTEGKRGRRGDKVLHVSSCDTVQDVKVKICRKMAIAPSEQTISTLNGKVLEHGTLSELGILPGCILYLEYNQALLHEAEIFERVEEQGFKGTVLSGHL